jgi:hypothetical protein
MLVMQNTLTSSVISSRTVIARIDLIIDNAGILRKKIESRNKQARIKIVWTPKLMGSSLIIYEMTISNILATKYFLSTFFILNAYIPRQYANPCSM